MNHNLHPETNREPPLWLQFASAIVFGVLWLVLLWGFVFGQVP